MVKKVSCYKCDVCGGVLDTVEDAECCELSHESDVFLDQLEYEPGSYIPKEVALKIRTPGKNEIIHYYRG